MLFKKVCFYLLIVSTLVSCKKEPFVPNSANALPGLWKQLADFAGAGRVRASGFTIGNKGYVLGGNAASGFNELLLSDFWEYDPETDKWTRKADYPGQASEYVRGFTINNKLYVGTGYGVRVPGPDTDVPQNNDFWEYNPTNDKWTRKADFAGGKRENVIAFEIDGIGYMGLGTNYDYNTAYKDLWKYNAATDKWNRIADYPGIGSFGAIGFAINGKGYAGLGGAPPDIAANDFWEYNPAVDKWVQKSDFKGSPRAFSGYFVTGKNGYAGMGSSVTATVDDWFKYDTETDKWSKNTNFPGVSRYDMVSFAIDGVGYIGTGNPGLLTDFYKYTPNKTN